MGLAHQSHRKYEALVDTGSQCTLIPSEYVGTEPISIAGVTGGITGTDSVLEAEENPSAVGLLKVEEQRVPVATSTVHRRQYRTNRDAVIPIHKMIRELESQGVVSKTHSPFNSPIWPVRKPDGEWRLTVDYRALNKVTPPLSAAVPDMLELQYELESKAAKRYTPQLTLLMPFSPFFWLQNAGLSLLSPGGACSTPGTDCRRGGNTAPPSAMD
ncbi:hypothetical protein DUI87_21585 [Hirundo rustica rustica]|uniref:Peptidase A2 domain-containing protein n=1 Tax=Hirundo rustica rustica TaxID=333673 RepID=A0A3M0JNX5_HIRRU|nr:hypothetical protein DUI87_21585 [Hirundo rustica rustica]